MKKTSIILSGNNIIFRKDSKETIIKNRYVKVQGLNTHYVETGEGSTVVLLNHWLVSWKSFILVIHELSKKYRVIVPDLPGTCGDTEPSNLRHDYGFYVDFVHSFLEKIKEDKIYIFGISAGGNLSLLYGKKYPQNIRKIVANSPAYNGLEIRSMKRINLFLLNILLNGGFFTKTLLKVLKFLFLKIDLKRVIKKNGLDRVDKDIIDFCLGDVNKFDEKAMVELAKDALSNDFSDQLKNMRIPTLVVSGDKDESVPFETSRRLADNILPNGKFVLMKGENHYVGVINPEKLCKHIIKFFN